eukprot:CAMPEP_0173390066 /NCGR_PEP_ID=MMETSP1356-20130122/14277_1 /TAXON_ID=77927 ORGANISM="Hemiselmis virescens, Strain PCC157" /NCGR_SAMPLE_ID=MMETSP1356 /ASSEMBLY_ACC=CAM_ASM_000847 /LENGTH=573 /DNA_ID=CAMNT_0014347385 /DNA_START=16 /DNA_END=1734 /DNA_ORIENTATION=-
MSLRITLAAFASLPGAPWPAPLAAIALPWLSEPHSSSEEAAQALVDGLRLAFALRVFLILATALHEWAHVAADWLMMLRPKSAFKGQGSKPGAHAANNLLFNVSLAMWAQCLCPITPWPLAAQPCVHLPPRGGRGEHHAASHDVTLRLAGALFSLLLALAASLFPPFLGPKDHPVCLAAAWMVASGAAATDVLGLGSQAQDTYLCGNFGMLVVALLEGNVDVAGILRAMAATTAARGGQSGGIVTVLPDGSAVRERHVPTKRSDIAQGLVSGFMRKMQARGMARLWAREWKASCSFFLGHTRFATSSAPTVGESHPHRFSLPQRVSIWRRGAEGWVRRDEMHEVYVTHNGDFDYWPLFGVQRTHKEVGAWLREVLQLKGAVTGCDSVKVAGIIELLRTQGVWLFSMRLGFQQTAAPSFDTTLKGGEGLLSPALLRQCASIADSVFTDFVAKGGDISGRGDIASLSTLITDGLSACRGLATLFPPPNVGGSSSLGEFVRSSVVNFVQNDLFSALSHFLSDAHGSFGISTCCTLDRDTVCIASRGQAMSVSFNPQAGTVLWGSESAAQNVEVVRK